MKKISVIGTGRVSYHFIIDTALSWHTLSQFKECSNIDIRCFPNETKKAVRFVSPFHSVESGVS